MDVTVGIFTIVGSLSLTTYILVAIGPIILIGAAFASIRRGASRKQFFAMIILAIVIMGGMLGFFHFRTEAPATITVGNGYVQISSPETGTMNFSSSQISGAFVSQIGSGNLSLIRQHGFNNGTTRIGVFTTENGATAYVVSSLPTDLVIKLTSGNYLIVGASNFTEMVTMFHNEVYPG